VTVAVTIGDSGDSLNVLNGSILTSNQADALPKTTVLVSARLKTSINELLSQPLGGLFLLA
jgi:hypothetical protein